MELDSLAFTPFSPVLRMLLFVAHTFSSSSWPGHSLFVESGVQLIHVIFDLGMTKMHVTEATKTHVKCMVPNYPIPLKSVCTPNPPPYLQCSRFSCWVGAPGNWTFGLTTQAQTQT